MKSKTGAWRCDNLLLFGSCKLSEYSLSDGGGGLERQAVHEHGWGCRHGVVDAQKACAASESVEYQALTDHKVYQVEWSWQSSLSQLIGFWSLFVSLKIFRRSRQLLELAPIGKPAILLVDEHHAILHLSQST
jgi:hypothetical protein